MVWVLKEHLFPLVTLRVNKRAARAVWFVVNEYLRLEPCWDECVAPTGCGGHMVMLERREG